MFAIKTYKMVKICIQQYSNFPAKFQVLFILISSYIMFSHKKKLNLKNLIFAKQ